MAWYHTFDDQFWIMTAGLLFAFFTAALKSKCSRMSCGCLEIERDIHGEIEAQRLENRLRNGQISMTPQLTRNNSFTIPRNHSILPPIPEASLQNETPGIQERRDRFQALLRQQSQHDSSPEKITAKSAAEVAHQLDNL